ncbi:MAG: hypothetical protein U1E42_07970 [Rhodospirillales bacterium]
MVTLNTIEEKMLELQRRKGALAEGLYDPEAGGPLDITRRRHRDAASRCLTTRERAEVRAFRGLLLPQC